MTEPGKSTLTSRIRREALRLGFFRVGFAPASPLPHREYFDRWIREGMHGEMAYMEAQATRRKDPSMVLEAARSLIIVAINYYCNGSLSSEPLEGRVSRYAWGDDYHQLVCGRLGKLREFILREVPAAHALHYVDTGPIMEKTWGAQTSLGWMGKHTNLITREQGSWFFIGVILVDLELEYDAPEEDYCGTCTRCIEACPTRAIVAPYVVDARLCISYLTIELRGVIPIALRPLIGNRIFGCDDCQEVCPWNRFAQETPEKGFQPRSENLSPSLGPLVHMTTEEFNKRYRASPVRRARRDGFLRNVVVALGNSHDPEAIPPLSHALQDKGALVRRHAAWALGQIKNDASRMLLKSAAEVETDREVRAEITLAAANL